MDAELADRRTVQHHLFVHQEHPVVDIDIPDPAIDRQRQHVAPAQGIAGSLAASLADDVVVTTLAVLAYGLVMYLLSAAAIVVLRRGR